MSKKKDGGANRRTRPQAKRAPFVVIDLSKYVPAFITLIGNRWSRSSSALYRRHFGIGIVEWRLMVLLANEPWIQASRVDEVVGMDKGAVSRSARFLAKRGLVMMRRNERDPRRREMALTEAGEYLHGQIVDIALTRESRLMAGISTKEREILIKLLKKMEANLDALDASSVDPFKGVQRRDDRLAASGSASWRKSGTRTASS